MRKVGFLVTGYFLGIAGTLILENIPHEGILVPIAVALIFGIIMGFIQQFTSIKEN